MVGTVEEALALREKGIGDICMGEVGGKPPLENPKISTIRHLSVTQPSRDVPAERMLISGKRPMCVEICITFDQYLKRR